MLLPMNDQNSDLSGFLQMLLTFSPVYCDISVPFCEHIASSLISETSLMPLLDKRTTASGCGKLYGLKAGSTSAKALPF